MCCFLYTHLFFFLVSFLRYTLITAVIPSPELWRLFCVFFFFYKTKPRGNLLQIIPLTASCRYDGGDGGDASFLQALQSRSGADGRGRRVAARRSARCSAAAARGQGGAGRPGAVLSAPPGPWRSASSAHRFALCWEPGFGKQGAWAVVPNVLLTENVRIWRNIPLVCRLKKINKLYPLIPPPRGSFFRFFSSSLGSLFSLCMMLFLLYDTF